MARRTPQATSLLIKNVRDAVVALLGAAGFSYEILIPPSPRSIIIWASLLMLGLPVGAITDRLLQRTGPDSSSSDPATPPPTSEDAKP